MTNANFSKNKRTENGSDELFLNKLLKDDQFEIILLKRIYFAESVQIFVVYFLRQTKIKCKMLLFRWAFEVFFI